MMMSLDICSRRFDHVKPGSTGGAISANAVAWTAPLEPHRLPRGVPVNGGRSTPLGFGVQGQFQGSFESLVGVLLVAFGCHWNYNRLRASNGFAWLCMASHLRERRPFLANQVTTRTRGNFEFMEFEDTDIAMYPPYMFPVFMLAVPCCSICPTTVSPAYQLGYTHVSCSLFHVRIPGYINPTAFSCYMIVVSRSS